MHPVECLLTPLVFSLGRCAGLRDVRAARRQGVQLRGGRRARRLRTADRVLLRTGRRVHVSTMRGCVTPRARRSTQPLSLSRMLVRKTQGLTGPAAEQERRSNQEKLVVEGRLLDKQACGNILLRGNFYRVTQNLGY